MWRIPVACYQTGSRCIRRNSFGEAACCLADDLKAPNPDLKHFIRFESDVPLGCLTENPINGCDVSQALSIVPRK